MTILLIMTTVSLGADPDPTWVIRTTTMEPKYTEVTALESDWVLPGVAQKGELVAFQRNKVPQPPWPTGPHAVLLDGTRLVGKMVDANDKTLTLERGKEKVKVSVPVSAIDIVWLGNMPAGSPLDTSKLTWLVNPRKKDTLLLSNNDTLRGSVDRFDDAGKTVRIRTEAGAKAVPTSTLLAIAWDPALARVKPGLDPTAMVVLTDGSRIHLSRAISDGKSLVGRLAVGGDIAVALDEVVSLDVLNGPAVFLADLKPKTVAVEATAGLSWQPVKNRSAKGLPIKLNTERGMETYDRGLGLHSDTTMTYDLAKKYSTFEATVGLDGETGRQGRVTVEVAIDGKTCEIAGLKELTYAKGTVPVRVDVKQANELTIRVRSRFPGDVQTDVNLGNARLIK